MMLRRLAVLALVYLGCATALAASTAAPLPIVPAPLRVELQKGAFTVDEETVLWVEGDPRAQAAAHYFGELLFKSRGFRTAVMHASAGPPPKKSMQFALRANASGVSPEGYELTVASDGVHLAASTPRGLLYGAVTLWQLLSMDDELTSSVRAPAVRIVDAPRLEVRGVALDSTAQFHSVEFVTRLLDAMAVHKLNTLHWSLTGDTAWRFEVQKRPRLTQTAGTGRARAFYTAQELHALVQHAAARNVTIIPALALPARAGSVAGSYPEATAGGRFLAIDEPAFAFLRDVLDQLTTYFPSAQIYIGGDSSAEEWSAVPKVQTRMRELGLAGHVELQRYFTARVESLLHERGRALAGGDAAMIGGAAGSTLVFSSRGLDSALGAAAAGYDVVVSGAPQLDLSRRQAPTDSASGELLSTRDVYAFDPAPAVLSGEDRSRLIGVQATLAADSTISTDALEQLMFPRAAALAEVAWSNPLQLAWSGFQQRLPSQLARYRKLGIQYSDAMFRTLIVVREAPSPNRAVVELSKQAALGEIRYTLDGGEPKASSSAYVDVFEVKTPAVIKAATFHEGTALTATQTLTVEAARTNRLQSLGSR